MNLTYSEHPIWASGSALQKKEVSSSLSLPKGKNHPKRGRLVLFHLAPRAHPCWCSLMGKKGHNSEPGHLKHPPQSLPSGSLIGHQ